VYDFPLLWRAQSYIDEGANDWNNLNPWNDPVNNGWYVSQANGAFVDGGQIPIKSWTRYYQQGTSFGDPNTEITGCIVYGWGCSDSVGKFNSDMDNQKNCLNISRNGGWITTLAPETGNSLWNNYDTQIRASGGTTYYPYRPGYSTTRQFVFNDYNAGSHVRESAGADCSGLVQRCASYTGNPYTLTDLTNEPDWNNNNDIAQLVGDTGIFNKSWQVAINDGSDTSGLIVPGDIIYMDGHVGIVCKILFTAGGRTLTAENVKIVEAAGAGWKTRNDRAWENLSGEANCQIRRLVSN
jgi:hypothetical protein